ncbi:MAG: hypothetical protein N2050_10070 [Flavobacteriales bacterium]|nr:hypothetical protein [Flavobacteriales bacterium]
MSHTHTRKSALLRVVWALLSLFLVMDMLLPQPAQQWSQFPPPGKKRGMYIDEAHNLVFALKETYDSVSGTFNYASVQALQDLVDIIHKKRLRYVALYNLDMGDYYGDSLVTPVLLNPDTWPALSALIGYLKSQQDSLEVGLVLSAKDTARQQLSLYEAYRYHFGVLQHVFWDNTGQWITLSMRCNFWKLNNETPPDPPFPPVPEEIERFRELKRGALQGMLYLAMIYNYGRGRENVADYQIDDRQLNNIKALYSETPYISSLFTRPSIIKKSFTLTGYAHKFDWINIEWEYWNNFDNYNISTNFPYASNRELWEAYVRILKHARYVKCLSKDRLGLESYVVLDPNLPGIPRYYNGYCWNLNGVQVDDAYDCVT